MGERSRMSSALLGCGARVISAWTGARIDGVRGYAQRSVTRFITRAKEAVVGRGDVARLITLAETLATMAGEGDQLFLNARGRDVAIEASGLDEILNDLKAGLFEDLNDINFAVRSHDSEDGVRRLAISCDLVDDQWHARRG